ncbi:MAG: hypothetical protein LBD58_12895 [Treponema sp.]|jgi:hypothetical protein|nr:hypothetical protein [Treponema sp.]
MADNREMETLQLFGLMFKLILKKAIPAAGSASGQAERLKKIISDRVVMINRFAFNFL